MWILLATFVEDDLTGPATIGVLKRPENSELIKLLAEQKGTQTYIEKQGSI
jgi:hypothetical protein